MVPVPFKSGPGVEIFSPRPCVILVWDSKKWLNLKLIDEIHHNLLVTVVITDVE